ncbi:Rne/Rng family ribonuclease [Candidatus Puniceispirillum sp.]|nr:Rne/Rng family ribonuclease [Candidatus Puniceispirillum sp.]
MTKRLLIDARQAEETRVVLLSGTRIEDFDYEAKNRQQLKGNVYLARVTRVEPSLQAAFVEYGGNRQGFLAFSEIHPDYYRIPVEDREALIEADRVDIENENIEKKEDDTPETLGGEGADEDDIRPKHQIKKYKIQEVISRKQIMLVQVVKEERGNKGAALTSYLSLAGRYCVLMPNNNRGGGVSRKITNVADRKRLKTVVGGLNIQDGLAIIVRTAGAKRTKSEITRDFSYLSKLWDDIRGLTLESQAPCLIHEEGGLIKRSIRDLYTNEVDEVLVEGEDAYKVARNQMKMLIPSHLKKVKKFEGADPIFQHFDIENQMDAIHSPQVTLKSGGYLVINQTEALVAIDVNSGKSTRERNIEETALKTNLEAADELGRQLRLRDLSGLIVVDFIDMEETRNQHAVERRMKDTMRNDRARIQIGAISHFGLLEMSRQRLRLSINESISNLCPHCEGTGLIRSIDTAALQLLRSIEEEAQKGKMDELHITAHRNVVLFILNKKRSTIAEIEGRFGITILLLSDDNLIAPEYTVNRVGWQSKSSSKQHLRQAPKEKQSGNDNDEITEKSESEDNIVSTHPTDIEKDTEDGVSKRRRRGRRGGRRRRRRNPEDGHTDENQTAEVQSTDVKTSNILNEISSEKANEPNNSQNGTSAKIKPTRGQANEVTKTVVGKNSSALKSSNSEGSNTNVKVTKNDKVAKEHIALKKPTKSQKKQPISVQNVDAENVDNTKNKTTAPDSSDPKMKKAFRTQKAKVNVEDKKIAIDQPTAEKKGADKKPARKPIKKSPGKTASTIAPKADPSKKSTSRMAISSTPQDVIEIGSSEPKSPRRGWWSRS